MIRVYLIAFAALLAGLVMPMSALACVNVVSAQPGSQPYDATSATQAKVEFVATFTEVCNQLPSSRTVEIWFTDDVEPGPGKYLGGVPFEIRNSGQNYLYAPGEAASPKYVTTFNFTSSSPSRTRDFAFILRPGYDATAATRQIRMHWTTTNAQGAPIEGEQLLTVGLSIVPVFSLQISGGGSAGTLDFGILAAGAIRSTALDVRASSAFTITATSQYSGAMRRVAPCGAPLGAGDQADRVTYTATINGQAVNLTTPYADHNGDGTSVRSLNGLPIEISIDPGLDPTTKRAGNYCDVLTLRIAPLN